jgi:thymidylate synthase (FAD)
MEDKLEFPMKIRFGEEPKTEWHNSLNNIKVTMTAHPTGDFRRRCYNMIKATWADSPIDYENVSETEVNQTFKDLIAGKVLPNSMEHLTFTFLMEGLTLVEITHMLRHRVFASVHAQCSADRFLQSDSAFIPSSIEGTEFEEEYKKLTFDTKKLYQKMVDSKKISILDARYILPRNHRYFYYFTMNLKDAMAFINQRKCTQIQPEMDNIIAHQVFEHIASVIPEVREFVSLNCGPGCFYIKAPNKDNSRIYRPDVAHAKFTGKDFTTLYDKKRSEMGVWFNPQDK